MLFEILFDVSTNETQLWEAGSEQAQVYFPFDCCYRYNNSNIEITQKHYNRHTLQMDQYRSICTTTTHSLKIRLHKPAYILIAIHQGYVRYEDLAGSTTLTLTANTCQVVYAENGIYSVNFLTKKNEYDIISIDPALLPLLSVEFDDLIDFMQKKKKVYLVWPHGKWTLPSGIGYDV